MICGLVVGFGLNCGAALNPARDLSPRLFQLLAGYGLNAFKYGFLISKKERLNVFNIFSLYFQTNQVDLLADGGHYWPTRWWHSGRLDL